MPLRLLATLPVDAQHWTSVRKTHCTKRARFRWRDKNNVDQLLSMNRQARRQSPPRCDCDEQGSNATKKYANAIGA
jgi:hypothetical protein